MTLFQYAIDNIWKGEVRHTYGGGCLAATQKQTIDKYDKKTSYIVLLFTYIK